MSAQNQMFTREGAKVQMESDIELTLVTIGLMLADKGRDDLNEKIKKGDWNCIPEVKNVIRNSITPDHYQDEEFDEIADSYETLLMLHMGVLPSSYEEIPKVLRNLRQKVKSSKRKDFDELLEYYESDSGESILSFASKCAHMVGYSHPIVIKSLYECWAITQESVEPVREIEEEPTTMYTLTS